LDYISYAKDIFYTQGLWFFSYIPDKSYGKDFLSSALILA